MLMIQFHVKGLAYFICSFYLICFKFFKSEVCKSHLEEALCWTFAPVNKAFRGIEMEPAWLLQTELHV